LKLLDKVPDSEVIHIRSLPRHTVVMPQLALGVMATPADPSSPGFRSQSKSGRRCCSEPMHSAKRSPGAAIAPTPADAASRMQLQRHSPLVKVAQTQNTGVKRHLQAGKRRARQFFAGKMQMFRRIDADGGPGVANNCYRGATSFRRPLVDP